MHQLSNIWLTTFADKRLDASLKRFGRQAIRFGFTPEHIILCNEDSLDEGYYSQVKSHLVPGSRGFGYWCWKPQVVLQAFKRMQEGDLLCYLDTGCHLNPTYGGIKRFYDYLETTEEFGLCGFQGKSLMATPKPDPLHHYRLERKWTKGDLFDYFHCRNNPNITDTGQLSGGIFLVKKNRENIAFFEQYNEVFLNDFHLVDDSPSISPNLDGFVENRHDQSIFSIMCKLRWGGKNTYSTMEYAPYLFLAPHQFQDDPHWGTGSWADMKNYPIHARRDKRIGWKARVPIGLFGFLARKYGIIRKLILKIKERRQ